MGQEKFTFQAEVSKLLDIVAHSLYSHKEIFLRELISNSSDACEKRSFLALTQPELTPEGEAKIMLAVDAKKGTLAVADNGIGMNHDDLVEMLGTIARSGTQAFLDQIAAQAKKKDKKKDKADISPIGQFGVGFYSAFMVAKKVEVLTRKAGEDKAWLWVSDGKGEFSITDAERGEVAGDGSGRAGLGAHVGDIVHGQVGFNGGFLFRGINLQITVAAVIAHHRDAQFGVARGDFLEPVGVHESSASIR